MKTDEKVMVGVVVAIVGVVAYKLVKHLSLYGTGPSPAATGATAIEDAPIVPERPTRERRHRRERMTER